MKRVVAVIVWLLDLQLPMQSMSFTTKVVSLNPIHVEVYSIQQYVIKFVSRSVLSAANKTGRHDINEILLKVALNSINQIQKSA